MVEIRYDADVAAPVFGVFPIEPASSLPDMLRIAESPGA
jgi:hypothetical protein